MAADEGGSVIHAAVAALCDACRMEQGRVPPVVVAIGGTAMALHGLRAQSDDVDLYCADHGAGRVARGGFAAPPPASITVDVSGSTRLWSDLDFGPIGETAQEHGTVVVGGAETELKVLRPETLFLVKANACRDKDLEDLRILGPVVDPESVFARLADIWFLNAPGTREEALYKVVSAVEETHRWEIRPEWLRSVPPAVFEEWKTTLIARTGDPGFAEAVAEIVAATQSPPRPACPQSRGTPPHRMRA